MGSPDPGPSPEREHGVLRSWGGLRKPVTIPGTRGCIVTFNYGGGDLRVLEAKNARAAFAEAERRWGDGWIGEPCVSTVDSIYNDVTGWTRAQHGQDFAVTGHDARRRSRFRERAIGSRDALR